jgi:hypothetical protein
VRPLAVVMVVAAVGGCAVADTDWRGPLRQRVAGDPGLSVCVDVLAEIRGAVAEAGSGDAEAARIPGFPYLRINRFLAGVAERFGDAPLDGPAFDAWVARLRALDVAANRIELANMPQGDRLRLVLTLDRLTPGPVAVESLAERCGDGLQARDLTDEQRRRRLLERARVPDNYSYLARIVGLYPIAAIPVAHGWQVWKDDNLGSFHQPMASLPVNGTVVDWVPDSDAPPLSPAEVARIVEASRDPNLGIPEPKGRDLKRLVATFAPIWRVDVTGAYDRIGAPAWPIGSETPEIDTDRPTTFVRIGHAFFKGEILVQVSYAVWFPERPGNGGLDILAGHLDGVIWRVTIGPDGRPLVYDTIHACGCYHLFFPVPPLRARPINENIASDEIATVPEPAPVLGEARRMILRLAGRSHFLLGLAADNGRDNTVGVVRGAVGYVLADDDELRSLAIAGGGRRSLFQADGLVAGTERWERFVLWPMGISSPGAMRQWGNHATAFVGRRHFDDPDLIAKSFER